MEWRLELVGPGPAASAARIGTFDLGEIAAPARLDEIGLDHAASQGLLAELQQAIVALQEAALRSKAIRMRADDPMLRLKDYRMRSVQTLFGILTIRVPRLVSSASGTRRRSSSTVRAGHRSSTPGSAPGWVPG